MTIIGQCSKEAALDPTIQGLKVPERHAAGTLVYNYGAFVVSVIRPPVDTCAPKTPGTSDFE